MVHAKKGISPLVATIMLIAFTLIISGMLASFVTQLTRTQQIATQICMDARVLLDRGVWFQSSGDPMEGNLTLVVNNYGKVPLNFQTILTYSDETLHGVQLTRPYMENGSKRFFPISSETYTTITLQNVTKDLVEVTLQSTRCNPPCYECPAAQDFLRYIDIKGIGYI